VFASDTRPISQGQSKEHKGTKYSGTIHHRIDIGWYTQSILKRNKHWNKPPTTYITFIHQHTEALDVGRKCSCKMHQTG